METINIMANKDVQYFFNNYKICKETARKYIYLFRKLYKYIKNMYGEEPESVTFYKFYQKHNELGEYIGSRPVDSKFFKEFAKTLSNCSNRNYYNSIIRLKKYIKVLSSTGGPLDGIKIFDDNDLRVKISVEIKLHVTTADFRLLEKACTDEAYPELKLALLRMLFMTGLRVSHILKMKKEQLNLEEGYIRVPPIKRHKKEELLPLYPELIETLKQYYTIREDHSDYVFSHKNGKKLTADWLRKIIKNLCLKVGITKNYTPHCFRRGHATVLYNNGADLVKINMMLLQTSTKSVSHYIFPKPSPGMRKIMNNNAVSDLIAKI